MIDVEASLTTLLLSIATLTAKTDRRIYAGTSLPAGSTITAGKTLLFNMRGGDPDFSSKVLYPSIQFRSYGPTEEDARDLDRTLFDVLHDYKGPGILNCTLQTLGQLLYEPDTNWPFILSYYQLSILNP